MRAGGIALPIFLAVALATGAWTASLAASAAEAEESEAEPREPASRTIYKWIDENGIAHYTTDLKRIPDKLRDRVGRLGPAKAALDRTPADDSGTIHRDPLTPAEDVREYWAVRDRSYERPLDVWDAADDYGDAPAPELAAEDGLQSDSEVSDRHRQLEDLDQRIASLQADIAVSEEALKALISLSIPEGGGAIAMSDDARFREIADRLPDLLADLRALQDERAQLEAP